tara:strand:+ start:2229 stop:2426 length:198 start_codon:yes stop_codon:yes gene_type:complete
MATYYGENSTFKIDHSMSLKDNFDMYISEVNRERYANEGRCSNNYRPISRMEAVDFFIKFCGRKR